MQSNKQTRNAATALALDNTKRQWKTPRIMEAALGSTEKTPDVVESFYSGVLYGPS